MAYTIHRMPTGFEDVVEAEDVALDVGIGVVDAVAHSGLGGDVDHDIELVLLEQLIDKLLIGNAAFYKRPRIARITRMQLFESVEAVFLQGDIVIVVHVVNANNSGSVQVFEQTLH